MVYTLVLGIEFKKYKKPANILISSNNKFIDTFDIDKDFPATTLEMPMIESKWYEELKKPHWLTFNGDRWKNKIPRLFKVYQIDEEYLYDKITGKGSLEIKVKNSNTDFTNGFMKNDSRIKLSQVALFPSYMSQNNGEKLMKVLIRMDNAYWKKYDLAEHYRKQFKTYSWPMCQAFISERQNETYEKTGVKDTDTWIGGDFIAKIHIKEKFKMLCLLSAGIKSQGFWGCATDNALLISSCKPLLNTYDENQ